MLTPEQEAEILQALRDGESLWSAVVGHGIPWQEWVDTAESLGGFHLQVDIAEAQARGIAERAVRLEKPLEWLTKGPGKARPDRPGWGDRIEITGANGGKVAHDLGKLSDAELEILQALTTKLEGHQD